MTIDFTNPAGKGAQPRPFSDYEQYKTNWDLIFSKKKPKRKKSLLLKTKLHEFYKPIGEILWASFYL